MMKSLTKRQEEILLYIISDFQKTSRLPSISDIAREFSFNKRAAYEAVDALIKKECLKKTEKGELLLSDDYRKHLINIKIPSFNNVDKQCYVMLKDAEEGECFSYTVSTDEMRNIGIMPGDECIFLSCTSAKSGDIVLCSIEDSDSLMLRRLFMRTDGLFELIPENDTMGKTTANKVIIHGRLILSVRRYLG